MAPKRKFDFPSTEESNNQPLKLLKSSKTLTEENVIIILDETHSSDWLEMKLQSTQFLVVLLPQLNSILQEFGYTIIDDPMVRSCVARITGKCSLSKVDRSLEFTKINLKAQRLITTDRTFVLHLSDHVYRLGDSYIEGIGAYHNDIDVVYRYKHYLHKFNQMKSSTAIQLLRKDPQTLLTIPERFYQDPQFLSEAISTELELLSTTEDLSKNVSSIPETLVNQKTILMKVLELGLLKDIEHKIKRETLLDREILSTLLNFASDSIFYSAAELYSKDKDMLKILYDKYPYMIIKKKRDYLDLRYSPNDFKYLDHKTRNDKEFVLKIVEKCPIYNFLSVDLQKDRNIALKAVCGNADYFEYLPREFRCDKEIACVAISNNPGMYFYASENLKEDYEFIQIFKNNFHKHRFPMIDLRYLPLDFRKDKEMVMKFVNNDGEMILLASEEFLHDREVLLEACFRFICYYNKNNFRIPYFIPESFRKDASFMLEISTKNPICLELAHEELRNDRTFLLEFFKAIKNFRKFTSESYNDYDSDDSYDGENVETLIMRDVFKLISNKFLNDRSFVLECLEMNAELINFFPNEWKNDMPVMTVVLKQNPSYYKNIPKQLMNHKNIIMLALADSKMKIPSEFENDKDIVMKAMEYNPSTVFKSAPEKLQKDRDVILHFLRYNKSVYDNTIDFIFLSNSSLSSDSEVMLVLLQNRMIHFKHIDDQLKKDPEFAFQFIEQKCKVNVRNSKISKEEIMNAASIDYFIEYYLVDEDYLFSCVKKQVLGVLIKLFSNDDRVIQALKRHQKLFQNDREFTLECCLYEGFCGCLGTELVTDLEFMKRATLMNFNNLIYSKGFFVECWTNYLTEKLNYKRMRKCFNYLSRHSFDLTEWDKDTRNQRILDYMDLNILRDCNRATSKVKSTIAKFLSGAFVTETKLLIHEEVRNGVKIQMYFHMDNTNRKWKKIMYKSHA